MRFFGLACLFFSIALPTRPAHATLLAEETFAYPVNDDLRGKNGGTGWAGAWTGVASGASGSFKVKDLASEPAGVAVSGSALFLDGKSTATRIFRQLDLSAGSAAGQAGLVFSASTLFGTRSQLGKPGTTLWLGFIARGDASSVSAGTHLFEGLGTGKDLCNNSWTHDFSESDKLGENIFIGRGNGNANYGYERTCGHGSGCTAMYSHNLCNGNDYQSGISFSSGVVHWVVLRMDFGTALTVSDSAAATITMWVDPTPGPTDLDVSTGTQLFEVGQTNVPKNRAQWVVSQFTFDTVELQSVTAGAAFDEYRIGTTYADVVGSGAAPLDLAPFPVDMTPPPPDLVPPTDLTGVIADLSAVSPDLTVPPGADLTTVADLMAPPGSDLVGADLASPDLAIVSPADLAGAPADAGGRPLPHPAGCGCEANGAETPGNVMWVLLTSLALMIRRPRRT